LLTKRSVLSVVENDAKESAMLTAAECKRVNDIGDKLLELYSEREDASSDGDMDRVEQLQTQIDAFRAERQKIVSGVRHA
jgi:hypothetical protein